MKYKKLKKLQHNRRATAYRTKKLIYENNPQSAALLELAHDIKKENIWQMPYVGRDQLADAEEYNATEIYLDCNNGNLEQAYEDAKYDI